LNKVCTNQGKDQIQADEAAKEIKNQLQANTPFQVFNRSG
jgi:hypothetical protein